MTNLVSSSRYTVATLPAGDFDIRLLFQGVVIFESGLGGVHGIVFLVSGFFRNSGSVARLFVSLNSLTDFLFGEVLCDEEAGLLTGVGRADGLFVGKIRSGREVGEGSS